MSLLLGRDADVAHWVCERIPHLALRIPHLEYGQVLGPAAAIGVLDPAGRMMAGVIYHGYDPFTGSIEISCAADGARWGNRETFRALLRYPFEQIDCQRVSAVTPRRGTRTRHFLEGLGFKREGSIRRGFGDDNAIIYGLLSEEWAAHPINRPRRHGELNGQEVSQGPAASP